MFKKILKFSLVSILTFTWVVAFVPTASVSAAFEVKNCKDFATDAKEISDYTNSIPDSPEKPSILEKCMTEVGSFECNYEPECVAAKSDSQATIDLAMQSSAFVKSIEAALKEAFDKVNFDTLKDTDNMCPPQKDMENKIVVYTEETLEDVKREGLKAEDPRNSIYNCFRNTLCLDRGDGLECETYMNEEPMCSEAIANIEFDSETGTATLKGDSAKKRVSISCEPVQAIIGKDGIDILYTYIGMIYRFGASMVGIIAVIVLVISGIQISTAAGDSKAITDAKTRIFHSILGIAILFLSAIILYTINPTFFVN